jgi:hypothetical protein
MQYFSEGYLVSLKSSNFPSLSYSTKLCHKADDVDVLSLKIIEVLRDRVEIVFNTKKEEYSQDNR